ncbi:ABC transporter substrate-binding protein [Bifidobacterium crudilactis]|jgi:osmoprotectant transport system substrate-binding protein|uniref:ABC transporter substrate-binding protein n=1 Tax=Bifidobacterium crudilactis TaxID=327277 RepID=A0A971CYR2_9BIFI|nr:ABC transporter substrate-binding protein [Bifidobacterium crudilactis]MDN5972405.1 ABC transporter substrate-binding protein [Bifidobacterium crudilactis]MDN6000444.1 ABC transporter substrate-binding protein [Bifidobacterium crudilactis]MDN6209962.1 ABC transporter substrate-binding protein [Bifidobacterium crudilactis]MDN6234043.1 ABC transporter substrate-binding protein [Bifidobacterium crudilactis]MDN6272192.1 ABC transporter substrate-binding protein [Bifidobacterium crudilactis]
MSTRKRLGAAVMVLMGVLMFTGCGNSDPLDDGGQSSSSQAIVIGSQDYYSNEIIAEIYAQGLEKSGYKVDRQFRIGQREVYLPEVEAGKIDLFPEYSGNLLQYLKPDTTARTSDAVYQALSKAMPNGLKVLDQSKAADQDSYVVTQAFADKWGISTIKDLSKVTDTMTLGGNSELETRPYGPKGLEQTYGVKVSFTPIEDQGGPLTVKALNDNSIQLANISTASPELKANHLLSLKDPQGLFLASNVVPVASKKLDDKAVKVINDIDASLSTDDLISMNVRSTTDQESASKIATAWLKDKKL